MSEIVWAHAVLPPPGSAVEDRVYDAYDPPLVVPRTRALPFATAALALLPDRRAYRSLSRAGVLLCAAGLPAGLPVGQLCDRPQPPPLAAALERDPYSVGIYCAIESGPQNYEGARDLAGRPREEFAASFRQANHPKRYLTQLANLPAAHLGIFLGVRGPVNVFCHSTAGCLHALEQAEIDLAEGRLAAALVCAAFSLEDPLLARRSREDWPLPAVLAEGAAALVLAPGGGERSWRAVLLAERPADLPADPAGDRCGIAQPLIDIVRIAHLGEEPPAC